MSEFMSVGEYTSTTFDSIDAAQVSCNAVGETIYCVAQ
jgi:hypothetical protein